ncbi:MAG: cell division protein FtsB [Steroidobacteraceae bacterium]|jgi:cell division protein FtsB
MTKWFAGVLVCLTVLLQYRIWLSDDGVREAYRLRQAVDQQTDTNAELRRRNEQLAAEVADLKSGLTAIEERARSELGMIATGESFYQVVPKVVSAPAESRETPTTRTAQR